MRRYIKKWSYIIICCMWILFCDDNHMCSVCAESYSDTLFDKNIKGCKTSIPSTVTIDGYGYKVTAIANKACKDNKKLKSVKIGRNVKKIGKEAFLNCKRLRRIAVKSTVLKSIGKNSIKGIYKKAIITVPKERYSTYKKLLTSKTGYKKTMKIKK